MYHPDVNKSAEAKKKFAEINEAHETLKDEKKRRIYDQTGMSANEQDGTQGPTGFNPFSFAFGRTSAAYQETKPFAEILKEFKEFFDLNDRDQHGSLKAPDITTSVEISFMEAANGTKKQLTFQRNELCFQCKGTKVDSKSYSMTCPTCDGHGFVMEFDQKIHCDECDGEGRYKPTCATCDGLGAMTQEVSETADIPQGVSSGNTLRMAGKGNVSTQGGRNGDLLIKVRVREHSHFWKEADTLHSIHYITPTQAILGAKVKVKTLSGTH